MGKPAYIGGEIDDRVAADVALAVSSGELQSSGELVTRLVTEWSMRRAETPEFIARTRAAIEASRQDLRPGAPVDEVCARLIAKYTAMIDDRPD